MTALILNLFIQSLAIGAASVIDTCITASGPKNKCRTSTGPHSDQSSLLQGKISVAHEGATDKTANVYAQDVSNSMKNTKAVWRSAGEVSAQQHKSESFEPVESILDAGMPIAQFQVSNTLRANDVQALHTLLACWYSGTSMKWHDHHKIITVIAFVGIVFMMSLPMAVRLNMLLFLVYVLCSSSLLFVNSYLVHEAHLQPVIFVVLHMFTSACVTRSLYCAMPNHFPGLEEMKKMSSDKRKELYLAVALIVVCFAAGLVLENSAYAYASVAFLQMLKETSLIILAVFALALGLDTFSLKRLSLLLLVIVGACMCVRGEVRLTFWGPAIQLLSNICTCLRLTIQNQLLVQKTGTQLDPLSYVALVSPICFMALFLPALAVLLIHRDTVGAIQASIHMISLSCALAVGVNLLVAVLVQRASAIGFSLLGACKNALILLFSWFALGVETSICQALGCSLIISASTVYAVLTRWEKQEPVDLDIDAETKITEVRSKESNRS